MLSRGAALLLTGLAASGCQSLSGGPVYAGLQGRFIDDASVRDQTAVPHALVSRGKALGVRSNLSGRRDDVRNKLAGNVLLEGGMPSADTSRYLDHMRDTLLAQWPHARPASTPRIEVTCSPGYAAESSSDGTIRLSQGLLEKSSTDDEIAFVLGHELGHLLLQHQVRREQQMHESENMVQLVSGIAIRAATVYGGRTGVSETVKHTAETALLASMGGGLALAETLTTLIDPGWSRRQEEEADLVGIDLMTAAGYDPRYSSAVLDQIQVSEDDAKNRIARVAPNFVVQSPGKIEIKIGAIVGSVVGTIRNGLRVAHPDAKERDTFVAEYRGRTYPTAANRAKTTRPLDRLKASRTYRATHKAVLFAFESDARRSNKDPRGALDQARRAKREVPTWWGSDYLMALAYDDLDQRQQSLQALGRAVATGNAPYAVYERQADEFARAGDLSAAVAVLDRAADHFDDMDLTLPDRIALFRAAGNQAALQNAVDACAKSSNPRLRENCTAVATPDQS